MDDQELLQSILQVGIGLSVEPDRHKMLDTILSEARKIASAEAGSLYVLQAHPQVGKMIKKMSEQE